MTDNQEVTRYVHKAIESLDGAESELANRRFNNCANRCYYACFQAAIAGLLAAGIQARSPNGQWRHEHIQAQFAGQLINRRKLYPATFRRALGDHMLLRHTADYDIDSVSEIQAHRALRRTRELVEAVSKETGITR